MLAVAHPVKTPTARGKILVGVILILTGVLFILNGLLSGPHGFWNGLSGVVGLCFAGLMLAGVGGKMIYDGTHIT